MSVSLSKSKFNAIIENERKSICNTLKSHKIGNSDLYKQIMSKPVIDVSKLRSKREKSDEPRKISGYILFSKEFRLNSKNMTSKECIRAAGEAWKKMDTNAKKSWDVKAKTLFNKSVQEYKKTNPGYDPNKQTVIEIPKARSAYSVFLSETNKSSNGKVSSKEMVKKVGDIWKKMTAAEKKPYADKAEAFTLEAQRFNQFVDEITAELLGEGVMDTRKTLSREAAKRWMSMSDEDKNKYKGMKPAIDEDIIVPSNKTAYNFFVNHCKNDIKEGTDLMSYASERWKKMNDTDKKPFVLKAGESKSEYMEFKKYLDENRTMLMEMVNKSFGDISTKSDKIQKKIISKTAAKMWRV